MKLGSQRKQIEKSKEERQKMSVSFERCDLWCITWRDIVKVGYYNLLR